MYSCILLLLIIVAGINSPIYQMMLSRISLDPHSKGNYINNLVITYYFTTEMKGNYICIIICDSIYVPYHVHTYLGKLWLTVLKYH